jgi:hypothetical protein
MKTAASDAAGTAKFAGVFQISYDDAVIGHYSVNADGAVTWSEENGKPVAHNKGKMVARRLILCWNSRTIWHWSA